MPRNRNSYLLSWQAHKFENFERHPWWGIILFVLLIFLLIYSLLTDNFLLSIILILAGIIVYLFEKKDPETYHFAICETGVIAHDKFYEFLDIENFWLFYEPGQLGRKELSLKTTNNFLPYVHIPLGDEDPNNVREVLLNYIPEEPHKESFLDFLENIV
jgi:hypothetical protein